MHFCETRWNHFSKGTIPMVEIKPPPDIDPNDARLKTANGVWWVYSFRVQYLFFEETAARDWQRENGGRLMYGKRIRQTPGMLGVLYG